MNYVDAGEVRTWYAEHGTGEPLALLHGAFTDASEFGARFRRSRSGFGHFVTSGYSSASKTGKTGALAVSGCQ